MTHPPLLAVMQGGDYALFQFIHTCIDRRYSCRFQSRARKNRERSRGCDRIFLAIGHSRGAEQEDVLTLLVREHAKTGTKNGRSRLASPKPAGSPSSWFHSRFS